ncbi:VOC family protein [Emticicia sp. CRIBPO]|uniref:VOC family protein n=1 Tax=Emticicia sp. CRIBPO TaxID=2683258 RepID=UPI001413760D|nr:VOC family protein [Emticicia sp. CRIBPO]NBA86640.1 VOC family protein [Emticicia sp. CRIBPO]
MDNPAENPNVKQAVPFFMVTDMARSLHFYLSGLGFELKIKWEPEGTIEWCWLQLGEASLMLQEYRNNVPAEKRGVGVSIVFMCNDALKIYRDILERGLVPKEPFVGNNLWVTEISDPDGYHLFFESPANVPEETRYSEWIKTNGPEAPGTAP